MRISDWSSDVCSSDLAVAALGRARPFGQIAAALDRLEAHHRLQSLDAGQFRQIVTEQFVEMVGRARENLEQIVAFACGRVALDHGGVRSEEHTSELQSLMRISYAVFCLKKKKINNTRQ